LGASTAYGPGLSNELLLTIFGSGAEAVARWHPISGTQTGGNMAPKRAVWL
jgi:hypothetical protein